jgi:hypothetical protein
MEKPIPPGDYDCCESGCEPCVWDVYQAEMAQWRAVQTQSTEQAATQGASSHTDSQ